MNGLDKLILSCLILTSGCASYKKPASDFVIAKGENIRELQKRASESKLYNFVPRHREQLKVYDARWLTWCALGNDDGGIFGEFEGKSYAGDSDLYDAFKWYIRNPAHNFTFYVIGSAWKDKHSNFTLIDLDSAGENQVLKKDDAKVLGKGKFTFYLGFNDYKPFLSSRLGFFEFYTGWRERGNFSLFSLRGEHSEKRNKKKE